MKRIWVGTLGLAFVFGLVCTIVPGSAALAGAAGAVADARPGVLNLRTGDVATATQPDLLQAGLKAGYAAAERYVIQLDGPITPERRAALTALGVKLGDYLPSNAFIADLSQTPPAGLAQLGFVTWVGAYRPEWRIDPLIGQATLRDPERLAIASRGELVVTAYLFDGEPLDAALTAVSQIDGAEVVLVDYIGTQPLLNIDIPAGSVQSLATIPSIQFVEEYPEVTYRNTSDRWIVQSNIVNVTPLYDNGIHGEGQVLGHIDGKVAVAHCSFYDPNNAIGPLHRKILAYNESQGYDTHGTHTAGTGVGDAGAFDDTRGVAYLGRLVHNSTPATANESQLYNRLDLHRTQGATVHTNSWGNDGTTAYDGWCRAIDNFSWLYDDNLVCFAVTNTSSLKNPENAKDCLAVGATYDTPSQANRCYGGTGPTADGRRKPEIYAPGCSIYSASGSTGCSVVSLSGTSMASPAISGTGLLVRQYFTAGYYPTGSATPANAFTPSGALVKAALLNSAVDMTGVSDYPSNAEGWGRVLADNVLYFPGDTRTLIVHDVRNNAAGALTTGGSATYNFVVTGATEQLRVTLVWHDAPAAVNATNAAVNNLDLVVTTPTATSYLGNVFAGGVSAPGGVADAKNNVEQVHLTSPALGAWTATVNAAAVNTGSQGYAIVITGAVSEATCPSFTMDPNSQSVCSGGGVTFTAAASGTPTPTYQWRYNGEDIGGATDSSYTINPVDPNAAGNYDCVATNSCGSDTSNAAALTVQTLPTFTGQPDAQAVCAGGSVTFTAAASGTPAPTYQWRYNGGDIGGETGSSYTIDPVDPNNAGNYDCVATNACGSVPGDTAALTVQTAPAISVPPTTHTALFGQAATFTVTADGTPAPTYQWRKGGLDLLDAGNISGVTTATLSINPVTLADAGSYDVLVTNACDTIASAAGTLWLAGDVNCDGVISFADINPFVLALSSQSAYEAQYPDCFFLNADVNGDGVVSYADINPFVALLGQ